MFASVVTRGCCAGLHGVLLGGQAEGVVAHRVQHVVAASSAGSGRRRRCRCSPAGGRRAGRRRDGYGNMSSTYSFGRPATCVEPVGQRAGRVGGVEGALGSQRSCQRRLDLARPARRCSGGRGRRRPAAASGSGCSGMEPNGSGRPVVPSGTGIRCNGDRPWPVGGDVLTMTQRIEAGADRGHDLTFVVGGDHVAVPYRQLHEEARGYAANLQALGRRPRRPRRPPRPHLAGRWSPPSRRSGWPAPPSWCCRCRCGCRSIEEFVAQTRVPHHQRRRHARAGRPGAGPVHRAGARRPADGRWDAVQPGPRPARRRRLGAPGRRPRPPGDPPVHQRVDLGPQGRDAPAPHARAPTSTPSPTRRRSTPTTTCSCRGCRCTTTWASSGCSPCRSRTGTPLVLGAPHDFMAQPGPLDGVDLHATAAPPPPARTSPTCSPPARCGAASSSTCPACGSPSTAPSRSTRRPSRRSSRPASRHGLRPGAVFPAFGMAEVAIAGTFPEPMSGLRTDAVDLRVLEAERYAAPVDADADRQLGRSPSSAGPCPASRSASSTPITGDELPGARGRRAARSAARSVTPGYYKRPDANAELFHDGWLRTGDLAYLLDGEMVMCGRIKDMIIVGGRNVFPEDVERALADVDGVRAGNVIAFGVDGLPGQGRARRGGREQGPTTTPRCGARSPSGCATPSASRPRRSCSSSRAACPRRARASSSARSARSATSAGAPAV